MSVPAYDRRHRDVPVEVDRRAEIVHTIEVSERIIGRGPNSDEDPVIHHMISEELALDVERLRDELDGIDG